MKSVDTVNDLLDSQDEGEGEVTEKEISADHNQGVQQRKENVNNREKIKRKFSLFKSKIRIIAQQCVLHNKGKLNIYFLYKIS